MLSPNDFSHIKLLYEQLSKLNKQIRGLIENQDWDSIDFALQDKNKLINKIVAFEKPRLDDIKENQTLNDIRTKLYEVEKQNLELVKKIRQDAFFELKNIKQAKKVLNAYEPQTLMTKSTIDLSLDD